MSEWVSENVTTREASASKNKSCSNILVYSKKVLGPYIGPKSSPLGLQKVKNDYKIKSKSNVRIKGNIENESCSTRWVDPKTVVEPYSDPKPAH